MWIIRELYFNEQIHRSTIETLEGEKKENRKQKQQRDYETQMFTTCA